MPHGYVLVLALRMQETNQKQLPWVQFASRRTTFSKGEPVLSRPSSRGIELICGGLVNCTFMVLFFSWLRSMRTCLRKNRCSPRHMICPMADGGGGRAGGDMLDGELSVFLKFTWALKQEKSKLSSTTCLILFEACDADILACCRTRVMPT